MSHSPPRPWHQQQGSIPGPPHPMAANADRRSPGYNHGPPPDWYKWHEQNRGRSPSPRRNSPARDHLTQRPSSPLDDRNSMHRANSPRNDRPSSPRSLQLPARMPPSPIRAPSPGRQERPLSPRRERHLSPRRERLSSPRTDRPRSPPYRPQSPLERHSSPRRERPLSPQRERPLSPRRERPLSPRRERLPSPRRERLPSPRRERPPSPRRERPPSPRRERPLSPHRDARPLEWRSRSPPRLYGPPPPHDWNHRSRSPPPHWIRRSPPRYGPPRGRSPPRGYWGPPPPEWDRRHGPPPPRKLSPPRWAPPPPHPWGRRWSSGHPASSGPPPLRERYPTSKPTLESCKSSSPTSGVEAKQDNKGHDGVLPPGDEKEEEIESYDLPSYDPEMITGQKYVIAVSGFFCKICHKFYNSELSARVVHCKSRGHYDKYSQWLSDKKAAALQKKREASASDEIANTDEEPPAKQIKLETSQEPETVTPTAEESAAIYDPSQPTSSEPMAEGKEVTDETEENEMNVDDETGDSADSQPSEVEKSAENEENGVNEADDVTDIRVTDLNEVKKEVIDVVDATLQNLRKLKVNEIKANLEKRGIKVTGLKPVLLKRLEKVLMEEATAVASDTEENSDEEQKVNEEQKTGGDDNTESCDSKMYVLKLQESDVEPADRKAQWITQRELERELLQLEGVKKVVSLKSNRTRLFNGRRTNVEWSITLMYEGEIGEDGLSFTIPSHQQLPFVALVAED